MIETAAAFPGPDLAMGVPISKIHDGAMLLGHANGEHRDYVTATTRRA
jgi:hypothetical protein